MPNPNPGEAQWRAHAELVGRVALASNSCMHLLFDVFQFVTGIGSPLAQTIYFALGSDRAQRDLVRKVARVRLAREEAFRDLDGLLKRLDTVAALRNSAVHGVFGITLYDAETQAWGAKVVPVVHPPQKRAVPDGFQTEFEAAEMELVVIRDAISNWLIWTPRAFRPSDEPPMIDWGGVAPPPDDLGPGSL